MGMYWWVHRHPDQHYPYGKSTNAFYVNTIAILLQLVSVILSLSMLLSLFFSKDEADEGWLKRWIQWSLPVVFADAVLAMTGLAFFIYANGLFMEHMKWKQNNAWSYTQTTTILVVTGVLCGPCWLYLLARFIRFAYTRVYAGFQCKENVAAEEPAPATA